MGLCCASEDICDPVANNTQSLLSKVRNIFYFSNSHLLYVVKDDEAWFFEDKEMLKQLKQYKMELRFKESEEETK